MPESWEIIWLKILVSTTTFKPGSFGVYLNEEFRFDHSLQVWEFRDHLDKDFRLETQRFWNHLDEEYRPSSLEVSGPSG